MTDYIEAIDLGIRPVRTVVGPDGRPTPVSQEELKRRTDATGSTAAGQRAEERRRRREEELRKAY